MDLNLTYTVSQQDYRSACYFGMRTRHHKTFYTLIIAVVLGIVYEIAGALGAFEANHLPIYIIGAYFVWCGIIVLRTELSVRRAKRSPDSMIGKQVQVHWKGDRFSFRIPACHVDNMVKLYKLLYVYEQKDMFLFYLGTGTLCLLPRRSMTDEQAAAARELLLDKIPERFESYYLRRPLLKKKSSAAM